MATKTKTKRSITKKNTRNTPQVKNPIDAVQVDSHELNGVEVQNPIVPKDQKNSAHMIRYAIAALFLIVVAFLARQGLIVAALVNGNPIFGWEVMSQLSSKFGKQTLEGLVTERLIEDAAKKAGVSVSKEEVESRENEMVASIGGDVSIDDLLQYQGISRSDFDNQVRLQIAVGKILAADISITDTDINDFIASYSASLVASEEGAMREEAKNILFEQKLGEKIQPWFNDLKEKASITRLY